MAKVKVSTGWSPEFRPEHCSDADPKAWDARIDGGRQWGRAPAVAALSPWRGTRKGGTLPVELTQAVTGQFSGGRNGRHVKSRTGERRTPLRTQNDPVRGSLKTPSEELERLAMGKTPRVHDHGGNRYGKKPRKVKMEKSNVQSFRCRECDSLRYVTPLELTRAARPRCLRCGGTLVEIYESVKRTIGGKMEQKRRAAENETILSEFRNSPKCWSCGATGDGLFLSSHLVRHSECRIDYKRDGKIIAGKYLKGTAYWEAGPMVKGCRYVVMLVSLEGIPVAIERHRTQADAQEFVDQLNGT